MRVVNIQTLGSLGEVGLCVLFGSINIVGLPLLTVHNSQFDGVCLLIAASPTVAYRSTRQPSPQCTVAECLLALWNNLAVCQALIDLMPAEPKINISRHCATIVSDSRPAVHSSGKQFVTQGAHVQRKLHKRISQYVQQPQQLFEALALRRQAGDGAALQIFWLYFNTCVL